MSRAIDNAGLIHTCIASAAFATNSSEISKSGMGGRGLNHRAQSNFHLSQTKSSYQTNRQTKKIPMRTLNFPSL
jgi:hypothetical protein